MIVKDYRRLQYVYFTLSGLGVLMLVILMYISVSVTKHENLLINLHKYQQSLQFIKPSFPSWDYNNTWQYIGTATMGHQIYSAYFDHRTDIIKNTLRSDTQITIGSIRIFAVLPLNFRDTVNCMFRLEDYTILEIPADETKLLVEHHDRPLAAYSIQCPWIRNNSSALNVELPQAVAIAYKSNALSRKSPTYVAISYARDMDEMFAQSKPVLSVCVGPLQLEYRNVLRIAEFVEMYRLQGATHFYFYDMETSPEVKQLLAYYKTQGIADVLSWNIKGDIHYNGIVAQFNECVYRALVVDNYRYAAVVDLDEMLMTYKHNSLKEFLHYCDEGRTSAFVFRNVFYYRKDSNDNFSVPQSARNRMLYTQNKIRRTVEIMPAYTRSKCIVNTNGIVEMGNHRVWRNAPGYSDQIVHQSVGLLYHYRDKCINCKNMLIIDYSARRFGSQIWERVDNTCLHVFMETNGICPLE